MPHTLVADAEWAGTKMLENEIESTQRKVKTDAYQMSIGEIVNMYKDNELIINPDFQRLFRWEIGQKAKLIESILLGIPVPSIFVFETEDGKWELIDGLQRISTILEFMGLLKDPDTGEQLPPSSLVATRYLSSLNNVVWQREERVRETPAIITLTQQPRRGHIAGTLRTLRSGYASHEEGGG